MQRRVFQCAAFTVVLVSWISSGIAYADRVEFRLGERPPPLAIEPTAPTSTDIINFTTPLDGVTYGNDCEAARVLGGAIILARDDLSSTIHLDYDGNPPGACPRIYRPVNGADGDFGPLVAGQWTLDDPHGNSLSFLVVPEPATAPVLLATVIGLAVTARRRNALRVRKHDGNAGKGSKIIRYEVTV